MNDLPQVSIVPNGKRYWVLSPKQQDTVRKVGEYNLQESADQKKPPLEGRVVAVGDAGEEEFLDPTMPPAARCKYKRSDRVVFGAYAGIPHKWEGVDYTILHEDEILGLVIETPFDVRDNTDLTQ